MNLTAEHQVLDCSDMACPPCLHGDEDDLISKEIGPFGEFPVRVVKTPEMQSLGVDVDISDGSSMRINGILKGLIADWNRRFPERRVYVGDSIVEVNELRGDSRLMMDRIVEDTVMILVVRPQLRSPQGRPV
eukprot:CAMPEP_0170245672 /NCGR_PEP_ID=MMETSP0116_2-20130129/22621_1 /TAXON_ID=400756 /ORGANISM="Durinskia baltica, Strain CSIRO CS-38" /LENGTH=131 /DNA_ID=CAMNT_0010496545 /DNA_START=143 /DNA_END=538 /DNA_ORIENTATION=-